MEGTMYDLNTLSLQELCEKLAERTERYMEYKAFALIYGDEIPAVKSEIEELQELIRQKRELK